MSLLTHPKEQKSGQTEGQRRKEFERAGERPVILSHTRTGQPLITKTYRTFDTRTESGSENLAWLPRRGFLFLRCVNVEKIGGIVVLNMGPPRNMSVREATPEQIVGFKKDIAKAATQNPELADLRRQYSELI